MRENLNCHCHICRVERHLFTALDQFPGAGRFRKITNISPVLATFTDARTLIGHLHAQKRGEYRSPSPSEVLRAIIQAGRDIGDPEMSQSVLVLAFMPTIHRTYREIHAWFQELPDLPAITIRDLLKASLRHRPDRIILGEIRGGEAFDLLQLLNTGHSGTLSTVHASSAAQALARFTSCVLQSGIELPYRAIKSNIADSLNVLIQLERRPGKRFISEVLEIRGYNSENDRYDLSPIFTANL